MVDKKEYEKKYREKHREYYNKYHREYMKKYGSEHKENMKQYQKKYKIKIRDKVLNVISNDNPHCIRCGCDDKRFLEINHKNGGGHQEKQVSNNKLFYKDILIGRRKINDLELLCRVCNARHYLELKFGELPYEIFYKRNKD